MKNILFTILLFNLKSLCCFRNIIKKSNKMVLNSQKYPPGSSSFSKTNENVLNPKDRFGKKIMETINYAKVSFGFFASAKIARALDIDLPVCSDAVTILKNINRNQEVVVIGTAHISEDSANLVREIIRKIKPDTVMIELDRKRIGKISDGTDLYDLGFDLPGQVEAEINDSSSVQSPPPVSNPFRGFQAAVSGWVSQSAGAILGSIHHRYMALRLYPLKYLLKLKSKLYAMDQAAL